MFTNIAWALSVVTIVLLILALPIIGIWVFSLSTIGVVVSALFISSTEE